MAAQQLVQTPKTEPSLTIANADLTRFIRLAMAKGNTGFSFTDVGLRLNGKIITAEYRSRAGTSAIVAQFPAISAVEGAIATNDPERLLKYLATFSDKDEVIVQRANERIVVSVAGGKSFSVGSINDSDVPRQTLPDPYGEGPKGLLVNSAKARRPTVDAHTAGAWGNAGYTVAELTKDQVETILRSGKLVHQYYDNAVVRFEFAHNGLDIIIKDPTDPTADSHLVPIDSVPTFGDVSLRAAVSIRYDILEPLWTSLDNLDWDSLTFIHHPDEARVNFLVREGGMSDSPGVTQICAIWKSAE
jgi:hypothetical protein